MEFSSAAIFNIKSKEEFDELTLNTFRLQAASNEVYKQYLSLLKISPGSVNSIDQIPFLPIEFFKTHEVITKPQASDFKPDAIFSSSGTTGAQTSKHYVADVSLYEK